MEMDDNYIDGLNNDEFVHELITSGIKALDIPCNTIESINSSSIICIAKALTAIAIMMESDRNKDRGDSE